MNQTTQDMVEQLDFEIDQADQQAAIERKMAMKNDSLARHLFYKRQKLLGDTETTFRQFVEHLRYRRNHKE